MTALTLHSVASIDHLVTPDEFEEITLESPALEVVTDFKTVRPLVLESGLSIAQAERLMLRSHVKLKIIIDSNNEFIGLLTRNDLMSEDTRRLALGRSREDIGVKEVMTPRADVKALSYQQLSAAKVADVVEKLKKEGVLHCLVVDTDAHHIRGLISASELSQRLHLKLDIQERPSFIDIFHAVHG